MSKAPARHEPPFYMAMTLMKYSCRHFTSSDKAKKDKYQTAAYNYIEKALKVMPQHHALLYHRAVFLFHKNDISAALKDTSRALKQASTLEQPVARILYLRGLLYSVPSAFTNMSKAIQDFSAVLAEDRKKEFPEAHLNRAKCLLFYGDKEAALADLQSYISSNPADPAIHQWTGIVFYHFKSYEESIRAYSNTINIKKNVQVLKLRADAYLASKQIKSCMDDLKAIHSLQPSPEI
jgi:tetratricopeptide (TPR) repeat protein